MFTNLKKEIQELNEKLRVMARHEIESQQDYSRNLRIQKEDYDKAQLNAVMDRTREREYEKKLAVVEATEWRNTLRAEMEKQVIGLSEELVMAKETIKEQVNLINRIDCDRNTEIQRFEKTLAILLDKTKGQPIVVEPKIIEPTIHVVNTCVKEK